MSVGTAPVDVGRPVARTQASRARALMVEPTVLAVAAITLLGAGLRFYRLGHQGFWFDEGNTALLVHFPPGKMLGLIPQSESTPPLYYCLAWVWARVFGYGETGLRSLSALSGVLVVPVAYGAGAKLISRRAGVIAAALTACSPLLIWYSQEARAYELLVLLSSVSLLAFAYARATPTPRWLAAWAIASALALATHYYAILAVVPEAVLLLWTYRARRPVQIAVGAVGLCGLALIPLAIGQNGTDNSIWIARAPLGRRLGQVVPQFSSGFEGPAHSVLGPLAIAMLALAVVLVFERSDGPARRRALTAGGVALAGLVLNLLLIAGGVDDLLTRNLLAIWMPTALFVAGGLAATRAARLGLAAAGVLCAIGVATAIGVAFDRNFERPDWRVVARALGTHPVAPDGRAILIQHYRYLLPLSLYLPGMHFIGGRGATVSEFDVVSFTAPRSTGFCWWGSACNLWPSRAQSTYPIAGFRQVSRLHVLQFTIVRMVATHPVHVTPAQVARALTATRLATDRLIVQK